MHAFDFIVLLFSFVYAAAVGHILSTAGEIFIAAKRIKLSWLNAGWMLVSLFVTCSWWIGLWDLHEIKTWSVGLIAFFFAIASAIYVMARMVSPQIPHEGRVDIVAFHHGEGRKYISFFAFIALATMATNSVLGQAMGFSPWLVQNIVIITMFLSASAAAIFARTAWVQVTALCIELAGWLIYFVCLQPPLSGRKVRPGSGSNMSDAPQVAVERLASRLSLVLRLHSEILPSWEKRARQYGDAGIWNIVSGPSPGTVWNVDAIGWARAPTC